MKWHVCIYIGDFTLRKIIRHRWLARQSAETAYLKKSFLPRTKNVEQIILGPLGPSYLCLAVSEILEETGALEQKELRRQYLTFFCGESVVILVKEIMWHIVPGCRTYVYLHCISKAFWLFWGNCVVTWIITLRLKKIQNVSAPFHLRCLCREPP